MESRIVKTAEKYRELRAKYAELKRQDLDENSIRVRLGLNPVQFHALKNREDTSGAHVWRREEEDELFSLYSANGTDWEPIRDALNERFRTSLTREQVKNKLYALRKRPEYKERFQAESMPEIRPGRRPRKGLQPRQKRQPPVIETPAPQNLLEPLDPLGAMLGLPELPELVEGVLVFPEPMFPEGNNPFSLFPEGPAEYAPAAPGLWTVGLMPREDEPLQPCFNFSLGE